MNAEISCREVLASYEVSAGTLRPTEKKKSYMSGIFYTIWKNPHLLFSFGWEIFIQTIGELKMKDQNEFGKHTKTKVEKSLRLGKVTLVFGTGGSLTDENLDTFFSSIKAIDVLTVRGLMTDMAHTLRYITDKMEKFGVICGQIRAEITL